MSHFVSLGGASLRALRSTSSIVAASQCATSPHRHLQKFSYTILSTSSNHSENHKSKKRVNNVILFKDSIARNMLD